MIIKKLNINNFGKFNNFNIEFKEGVNIIYGKNESGKTTLLNYILMMFYGNSSRSKDLIKNDRLKYFPWNKESMSGTLEFIYENKTYILERIFGKTNQTDIVKLIDGNTGEELNLVNPKEPGIDLFGIGYEAFKRTLFISSESMIIDNEGKKDEIIVKLLNLVTTGEEDISYKKVQENISKKKEEYVSKSGKFGIIKDLEREIDFYLLEIENAKVEENEKLENLKRVEELKKEIQELNNYQKIARDAIDKNNKIQSLESDINTTKKDLYIAEMKLEKDELLNKIENVKKTKLIVIIFSFLLILSIILGFRISKYIWIMSIFIILFIIKNINIISDNKKYINLFEKEYNDNRIYYENIKRKINQLNENKEKIEIDIKNIKNKSNLKNKDINLNFLDEIIKKIHFIENEIIRIQSTDKEKFRGKKNLSTLEKEVKIKKIELEYYKKELELLNLTSYLIEKSFKDIEIGYTQKINDISSELISEITKGKYEKMLVSKDFDISIIEKETNMIKEWKYLSSGTIDQIYLALRLSISKLIIENIENRILLLDDIFIRYDIDRFNDTLNLLYKTKDFGQVLLFSSKFYNEYNNKNINIIKL